MDAQTIVAGLTKAQRHAILHPHHGPFATSIYSLTSAACRTALQKKGIVVDRMYATALTPLGLAVRNELARQRDQQPDALGAGKGSSVDA